MKKLFPAAAAAVFMLCGCMSFLPAGVAPEGKITDNTGNAATTQEELENAAATSLCAYIMLNNPTRTINAADAPSSRVLQNVSGVTGVQQRKNAIYRLEMSNGTFKLFSGKNLLHWQYPEKQR